jgi:hypothetical protein
MPEHPDFGLSKKLTPQMMEIVGHAIGPKLVAMATEQQDMKEATDLVMLQTDALRFALRARRWSFYRDAGTSGDWRTQFTLRAHRDSGARTELAKVVDDQWGNYMLYGFADQSERMIEHWMLVDLKKFRKRYAEWIDRAKHYHSDVVPNFDGTYFRWFDVRPYQRVLVAASPDVTRLLKEWNKTQL